MTWPEQTEAETLLTILGALLCLGGWLLFYLGTRLAGISAGAAAGLAAGQVLASFAEVPANEAGWWVLGSTVIGGLGGLLLLTLAARVAFCIAGVLIGALLGDGLATGRISREGRESGSNAAAVAAGFFTSPIDAAPTAGTGAAAMSFGDSMDVPAASIQSADSPGGAGTWTANRLQVIAAGAFLGGAIGLFAQKLFIIAITAYLGAALLQAGFPPLRESDLAFTIVMAVSVAVQSGLAWRLLKSRANSG